ncbi:lipopolysaccharide biosynthesis protein [Elioraea rosea]|uniref:lipopolysaccharide biosynthesis protein n=1 Tax=Elioraea rosea TaxID=2492390 RepID=UPI001186130B|nr:lipopolysaccharide biosynthesis protein [Elioraea rosea]
MSGAEEPPRLGRAMAAGSAWMIASRWMVRSIGLVSTVILARLLAPADFGLVAMAMLVVGAVEVLGHTGQRLAIIRLHEPTREHYDTAWTFGVLIGLTAALILSIAAPIAAQIFDEPRVTWIVWCLSLRPLMIGLENIGLVDLQRRLNFRRDQQVVLIAKLVAFVVTLSLAFLFRSYWALIAGILAQGLAQLSVSYHYSPYRPGFSLAKTHELWSFSSWTLVTHVSGYFADKVDQMTVGLSLGAPAMGTYAVGGELAALPTEELVVPPTRALYAVYSRVSHDAAALREHYLQALSFIALIACATSTGIALVAEDAVRVVLGEKWLETVPLLPWLALSAGLFGMARSAVSVLLAAGYARVNALRGLAFVTVLVPTTAIGVQLGGAEGVAIARLGVTAVIAPVMFLLLIRFLHLRVTDLTAALWRPLTAAALMAAAVMAAHPSMPTLPPLRLVAEAGLGAMVYVGSVFALWVTSGRPRGSEHVLFTIIIHRIIRRPKIARSLR